MFRWITGGVMVPWYPIPRYDRKTRFLDTSSRSSVSASCSLAGAGSSSARSRRIAAGTAVSISASSESYPTVSSISCTSASEGPM